MAEDGIDGEVFGRTGYRQGGPEKYVEFLAELKETGLKELAAVNEIVTAYELHEIGMDIAQGKPGDALEYTAAAGGAAYILGGADEALAVMDEHGFDAKLLAGGQSLIPAMNFRLAQPSLLVDLNAVDRKSVV